MASKSVVHEIENQFVKHINYRAESEKLKDNHILSDLRIYSYDFLF